ncbi:phosphatase [Pectinatus frisingensis]|jgi:putative hydrolase|uniref:phosphatase n=1 Tax=Pectinatus frisingensis TaxID=865 RepID=UPI0018C625C9|nr:phosphatase [Pectinatus frisingensis]
MKDVLDMHMHTIMSGHAYSSLSEMIAAGRQKGLSLIGVTEHAPALPGTCHDMYFHNFKVIDRNQCGIMLMMGAEVNVMSYDGSVDMPVTTLKKLDYAIISLHEQCIKPGNAADNTRALLRAMENPYVSIIGHPDNGMYPIDFLAVVQAAKKNNVLLELNNSSYKPDSGRIHSRENALIMLELCKKYEVSVIMDSDAHIDADVGNHKYVYEILQQSGFPEELVVNTDADKFRRYLKHH